MAVDHPGAFTTGESTEATGTNSVAMGSSNTAQGNASFAMGSVNTAEKGNSAAFGLSNVAAADNSFVVGKFNLNSETIDGAHPLFVVGGGTGPGGPTSEQRKNILTVLESGRTIIGSVRSTGPFIFPRATLNVFGNAHIDGISCGREFIIHSKADAGSIVFESGIDAGSSNIEFKDSSGGQVGRLSVSKDNAGVVLENKLTDSRINLFKNRNVHLETGASTFAVQGDGNVVLYQNGTPVWATGTNLSDVAMKADIQPIASALTKLTAIEGISFDWKDQSIGKAREFGVKAQQVEEVFPELMKNIGTDDKLVQYEKFVPVLIEAIKEQQEMIEELKEQTTKMEQRLG
ncbi:MAG: tail fiber domain-containing protein [Saprospiraceae bacterium]